MTVSELSLSGSGHVHGGHLDPKAVAVLLDVDGTLIEIASTPQEVRVPASLKHVLARLRDHLLGALCLVSGRPILDLDRLFEPLRVAIAGGHGAEIRVTPNGSILRSSVPPLDAELRNRLLAIAGDTPGLIAESKEYSVALHYRLVPEHEQKVHDFIAHACARWLNSVEVLPGKAVFEVKPRGFDKGLAIRELMKHPPFLGRKPIFIGDDVTDESAFKVIPEFDGRAYSVGKRLKGTNGYFATPREVRHWLYGFIQPVERQVRSP